MRLDGVESATGEQHAHGNRTRQTQREPLRAATQRYRANARLAHRERGFGIGDDNVARKRNLEAAAHRESVHRGDQRLRSARALGKPRPPARRHRRVGRIREIMSRAKSAIARARERSLSTASESRSKSLKISSSSKQAGAFRLLSTSGRSSVTTRSLSSCCTRQYLYIGRTDYRHCAYLFRC